MQTDCTITQSISAMPVMAGGKPPFSSQLRRCSHASAQLSGSLSANARRISAQVAWGSMKVSFWSGSVGKGNAGEPAEGDSLVPGQLSRPVAAVLVLYKDAERLGSFGETEEGSGHEFRRKHLKPVVVLLFGDLHDAVRDRDAINVVLPLLVLRKPEALSDTQLGDKLLQLPRYKHGAAPFVGTVEPVMTRNVRANRAQTVLVSTVETRGTC